MMAQFWKSIGTELGKRWLDTVFVPAFLFWLSGFAIWLATHGGMSVWKQYEALYLSLSTSAQVIPLIIILVIVSLSGTLIQSAGNNVLRFLEGYWPVWLNPVRHLFIHMQRFLIQRQESRWQALASKAEETWTLKERSEFIDLDWRLKLVPESAEDMMPTKLGNILRASETRPRSRYGLDPVVCWPRLWLVLPDNVKKELGETRARLDTSAQYVLWSTIFAIWAVWWPWAVLIAFAAAVLSYRLALQVAAVFGELVEATFDTQRSLLYEAARWPLPKTAAEEKTLGEGLTRLFLRGEFDPDFTFAGSSKQDTHLSIGLYQTKISRRGARIRLR